MMKKAIIFDKDGVLVDSELGKMEAMKRALGREGYDDLRGFEEWYLGRVGVPGDESCKRCVDYFGLGDLDPRVLNETTEKIRRDEINTEPVPLIYSSIEFLKSLPLDRLKIGVASSDFPNNIQAHMRQAGVFSYLSAMISGERNSGDVSHDKPHPEVYLVTAEKLGVNPVDCIGIEDTSVGVEAVKAAGMYCVGFVNPNSGKQDLSDADMVVDDLNKLYLEKLIC